MRSVTRIAGAFAVAGLLAVSSALMCGCTTPPEEVGASLRAERDQAVRAGVRWLDAYLSDPRTTAALGVDAVGIFSGYAASAADEESRTLARDAARRQARSVEQLLVSSERLTAANLLDMIYLLVEMHELGLDVTRIRGRLALELQKLPDPDVVYGVPSLEPRDVARLPEAAFQNLVLGVYAVERAAANGLYFGVRFRLEQFLPFLRQRPFVTEGPGMRRQVYRATHIAYMFSEYGRLERTEEDAPEVFAFLDRVFPQLLAEGDLELVAEIVDIWRNLGRDETTSAPFREGTIFLLESQNEDGSWGPGLAQHPYMAVHHTWCAIMALGERRFQRDTPYERHLRPVLGRSSGD